MNSEPPESKEDFNEGSPQDNFVEVTEPSELALCVILAAAYLGLAKYCWGPLYDTKNFKLLFNVEGFFITIAVIALLVGLRPYTTPTNLQVSHRGIKYRGPYWAKRKTINWDQVVRIYVSPELLLVMYKVSNTSKRVWPLLIFSIYLAERERIPACIKKYSPIQPIIMTSPTVISRILLALGILALAIWLLELLMAK